jgi:hypothetical protein
MRETSTGGDEMSRFENTLIVFLVAGSVLLLASAGVMAQPFGIMSGQPVKEPHKEVLSSPCGRYVFGQISDSSKDQFMLDTSTGRLWRISESGRIGIFLKAVPYCDDKGECSPLPEEVKVKEQPAPKKE